MSVSLFDQVLSNTQQPAQTILPASVAEPVFESGVAEDYTGTKQRWFDVESAPISGPHGQIAGKRGLFVNQNCINIVSDKYEIHQPREIHDTFSKVAENTGLEVKRVITNPHNGGLLMTANYDNTKITGESHDVNVTFYTSHCGKYKTFLTLDLLRLACMNQVPCLYRNKQRHIFAEKHYRNALNINMLESALEQIPGSVAAYNENAELLRDKKFCFDDFVEFYKEHYKIKAEQKQYDSKIEKLKSIYYNGTGQRELDNDSAYKAYQAITFCNTHEGRDTAMREENIITKKSQDSLIILEELLVA